MVWTLILTISVLLIACGGGGQDDLGPSNKSDRVRVVTTTALLADLVKNVGGDRVQVSSIVPAGADVHSFQTTPDDSVAISQAQMIVSNGFGLDGFLDPVIRSAMRAEAVHVIVTGELEEAASSDTGGFKDEASEADPHFWQDPEFAVRYVQLIRDGLIGVDPDRSPDYRANAEAYGEELRAVDGEIAETLRTVRPEFRHLVTYHDAFSHWARRYGWKVSAFVDSDADEVSPETVVQILDRLEKDSIPAVFVEPQLRTDVIQQAARDAGIAVGIIYSDLSDTGPATYIEMIKFNAQSLANHLK